MFCYQCEQTARGTGCTIQGVCGKDSTTAALQDLLVHACKGISQYAHCARSQGAATTNADRFIVDALFATVTNVDFDPERLQALLMEAAKIKDETSSICEKSCKQAGADSPALTGPAEWQPAKDINGLLKQAENVSIMLRKESLGDDITGLQELIMYGLKGTAAYAHHARLLGEEDDGVYTFFHETLDFLCKRDTSPDDLVARALKCGEVNLKVMELLDRGHTKHFGHPEPTQVRVTPVKGKCIVVSGHDLMDLEALLKQTEGKGINIYTHGEMLPAHGYPGLKKYPHLVGNYGGAWQDQQKEFDVFPGAILMTTNCIQKPRDSYKDRIFTCGLVAWPGVTHIEGRDFTPAIEAALAAEGFSEDADEHTITVGFGHEAVMNVADKVIDAVKQGGIRHFFLVGGCDGARPGRNYYTEFAQAVPDDCVILTLACGKFRFNKLTFGDIGGIPRLLDVGQCNDAYSAIQIAVALANAFDTDVNSLPLSFVLSWYEQKAVCILLTLLHLGIQNMRIGPSMPAFFTPNIVQALHDKFNIMPVTTPKEDLEAILAS